MNAVNFLALLLAYLKEPQSLVQTSSEHQRAIFVRGWMKVESLYDSLIGVTQVGIRAPDKIDGSSRKTVPRR